jgi:hypothetical protein
VRSSEGGGLPAVKMHDPRGQGTVGTAREQGRRESSMWATPRDHGPTGEEGKWAGPKENSTLLYLFENFKKI